MRILITGGTGYLGRAIVRAVAARGHTPVVFARSAPASGLPGALVGGDIREAPAVRAAAEGCDAICHTAALVSVWRRRREDFDEVNIGGLQNVLAAATAARVPRLVYTSSFLALPPGDRRLPLQANDYQRTKVEADRLAGEAAREGAPLIRVYPGVVYGPGTLTEGNLIGRLIADHLAGRLPGLIGASRTWSYAYVDDVAEGHVAAIERGRIGERYQLCGENAPQMAVFEIVRDLTGTRLPRRIPFAVATAIGAIEDFKASVFRRPPLLTRGTVEIFRHDWSYDSGLAMQELGYRITPLRDGVERTLASLTGTVRA